MTDQHPRPANGFSKRHVSGMLKHLADDSQRAKAQEVAVAYKKLFAEKKWEAVLSKMQRVVDEDNMRVVARRTPARLLEAGQSLLAASTGSASRRSRAPSTPRERWDVMSRGPATPLSPTPLGNAFANGGFWNEQLTPKTPVPATPLTAIAPASPFSPIVPQDAEARTAYKHVKDEVDALARSICANRLSITGFSTADSNDIPTSLLSPKDFLHAAQLTLEYHQLPLSTAINASLPALLAALVTAEKAILEKYKITDALQLLDVDEWLHIDEATLEFYTIFDAQRELTRMHGHRRKEKSIEVEERAVQLAWATRILEDVERAYEEGEEESESEEDEDGGYEYSNFLRSIKGEGRGRGDLAGMNEERRSGDTRASLRSRNDSSTSPKKPAYGASMRSSTSPKKPTNLPRRSREYRSSFRLNGQHQNANGMAVSRVSTDEYDTPHLSPSDRAFRRKGASHTELNEWAREIKIMEERQKRDKEESVERGDRRDGVQTD